MKRIILTFGIFTLLFHSCTNETTNYSATELSEKQLDELLTELENVNIELEQVFSTALDTLSLKDDFYSIDAKFQEIAYSKCPKATKSEGNLTFSFSNKIESILLELDKLYQVPSLEEAIHLIENVQKLAFQTLTYQEALIVSTYLKEVVEFMMYMENHQEKFAKMIFILKNFHTPTKTQGPYIEGYPYGFPDGFYPVPQDPTLFYIVENGQVDIGVCFGGNVFNNETKTCVAPDEMGAGWWATWGKCIASILSHGVISGLGGAAGGSVVPGIGTTAGAIAGAIAGALAGAVSGCD